MVLLPGCQCCKTCGWPRTTAPDSIEVVLAGDGEQSFQGTSENGLVQTVSIPAIAGTYLLTPTIYGDFRYIGTWLDLRFVGGGLPPPYLVSPFWLEVGVTFKYRDSVSPTDVAFSRRSGAVFIEECENATVAITRSPVTGQYGNPRAFGWPVFDEFPTGSLWVAFDAGCHLPGTINYQALFQANKYNAPAGGTLTIYGSNHTFPLSGTYSTNTYVGFPYSFRVLSIRYVYGSDFLPQFEDIGQTSCPPF